MNIVSKIILGKKRMIFSMPDEIGYWMSKIVGDIKGDVLVTREEIKGLKGDLLYTTSPAAGKTKLTDWLIANKDTVGKEYANEIKRRKDSTIAY